MENEKRNRYIIIIIVSLLLLIVFAFMFLYMNTDAYDIYQNSWFILDKTTTCIILFSLGCLFLSLEANGLEHVGWSLCKADVSPEVFAKTFLLSSHNVNISRNMEK